MKVAHIIPLFKSGDSATFTNYRPVSILPSFSKFLDRIVYNRLLNYIDKNKILWDSQYGFRKKHSTSLALIDIYDKISSAIDRREFAVGIFLHSAGIKGCLLSWLSDYLTNRKQQVLVKGCTSKPLPVTSGVPQGSILGPLLFIWYINDLPDSVSNDMLVYLFADDTKLARIINSPSDVREIQDDTLK